MSEKQDVAEDNIYWDRKHAQQLQDLEDIRTGKYTPEDYCVFNKKEMDRLHETVLDWLK